MEAFLTSTGVVAIAEIGDKTQLLALVLAARFRRPVPIMLGILIATLANHAAAAALGLWVENLLDGMVLRWLLALSFFAVAVWALVPDRLDDGVHLAKKAGAFVTTLACFFLVEIGDKTQVATVALAMRFENLVWVTLGTTFGMMLANVPVVAVGERAVKRIPLHLVRWVAAATFATMGAWVLIAA